MKLTVVALDYDGTIARNDFSRWISDVFGDYALARELQRYERSSSQSPSPDALERVVAAVRSRYDLTEERDGLAA